MDERPTPSMDPEGAAARKGRLLRHREQIGVGAVIGTIIGLLVVLFVLWLVVQWVG